MLWGLVWLPPVMTLLRLPLCLLRMLQLPGSQAVCMLECRSKAQTVSGHCICQAVD